MSDPTPGNGPSPIPPSLEKDYDDYIQRQRAVAEDRLREEVDALAEDPNANPLVLADVAEELGDRDTYMRAMGRAVKKGLLDEDEIVDFHAERATFERQMRHAAEAELSADLLEMEGETLRSTRELVRSSQLYAASGNVTEALRLMRRVRNPLLVANASLHYANMLNRVGRPMAAVHVLLRAATFLPDAPGARRQRERIAAANAALKIATTHPSPLRAEQAIDAALRSGGSVRPEHLQFFIGQGREAKAIELATRAGASNDQGRPGARVLGLTSLVRVMESLGRHGEANVYFGDALRTGTDPRRVVRAVARGERPSVAARYYESAALYATRVAASNNTPNIHGPDLLMSAAEARYSSGEPRVGSGHVVEAVRLIDEGRLPLRVAERARQVVAETTLRIVDRLADSGDHSNAALAAMYAGDRIGSRSLLEVAMQQWELSGNQSMASRVAGALDKGDYGMLTSDSSPAPRDPGDGGRDGGRDDGPENGDGGGVDHLPEDPDPKPVDLTGRPLPSADGEEDARYVDDVAPLPAVEVDGADGDPLLRSLSIGRAALPLTYTSGGLRVIESRGPLAPYEAPRAHANMGDEIHHGALLAWVTAKGIQALAEEIDATAGKLGIEIPQLSAVVAATEREISGIAGLRGQLPDREMLAQVRNAAGEVRQTLDQFTRAARNLPPEVLEQLGESDVAEVQAALRLLRPVRDEVRRAAPDATTPDVLDERTPLAPLLEGFQRQMAPAERDLAVARADRMVREREELVARLEERDALQREATIEAIEAAAVRDPAAAIGAVAQLDASDPVRLAVENRVYNVVSVPAAEGDTNGAVPSAPRAIEQSAPPPEVAQGPRTENLGSTGSPPETTQTQMPTSPTVIASPDATGDVSDRSRSEIEGGVLEPTSVGREVDVYRELDRYVRHPSHDPVEAAERTILRAQFALSTGDDGAVAAEVAQLERDVAQADRFGSVSPETAEVSAAIDRLRHTDEGALLLDGAVQAAVEAGESERLMLHGALQDRIPEAQETARSQEPNVSPDGHFVEPSPDLHFDPVQAAPNSYGAALDSSPESGHEVGPWQHDGVDHGLPPSPDAVSGAGPEAPGVGAPEL